MTATVQLPALSRDSIPRRVLRWIAAVVFIAAGLNHFRNPAFYASIVPPGFPSPRLLVLLSGIFEIAGGAGLVIRPLRRAAGWGLILLLVAVFPANVYMAMHPRRFSIAEWLLWLRLPLQALLIAWVWWVALARRQPRVSRAIPPPTQGRD